MSQAPVTRVEPRTDAVITLPDNASWSAPVNTPLEVYFRAARPDFIPMLRTDGSKATDTIVAALIDGNLRELTFPMMRDASVSPVMLRDGDGLRIYRRALSFLLVVA